MYIIYVAYPAKGSLYGVHTTAYDLTVVARNKNKLHVSYCDG